MLLVFAMPSFDLAGGPKVAEIYVALWHLNCMWPFHSRLSENNTCCLSSNMITALSPYISIRPEPTPLLVPGTYISNSIRPGENTLEAAQRTSWWLADCRRQLLLKGLLESGI